MTDRNPTIEELFNKVTEMFQKNNPHFNHRFKIVRGGSSRSILNNFKTKVLSYGLGFKGFVAIYKNKAGILKATGYELFWIYSGFSKGKFIDLLPVEADYIIRNTQTFSEKKELEQSIYQIQSKKKTEPQKKYVGEIVYCTSLRGNIFHKTSANGLELDVYLKTLTIYQYKNKKYYGRLTQENNVIAKRINEKELLQEVVFELQKKDKNKQVKRITLEELKKIAKKQNQNQNFSSTLYVIKQELPEEAINEMIERDMINKLKED